MKHFTKKNNLKQTQDSSNIFTPQNDLSSVFKEWTPEEISSIKSSSSSILKVANSWTNSEILHIKS